MNFPFFLFDLFLEARAEKQKYFQLFFGSNGSFRICFWDLLTFRHCLSNLAICITKFFDFKGEMLSKIASFYAYKLMFEIGLSIEKKIWNVFDDLRRGFVPRMRPKTSLQCFALEQRESTLQMYKVILWWFCGLTK
jgi:hypothetical protein